MNALYKRTVGQTQEFHYNEISVDIPTRRVTKGGEDVNLTIKEFYILEYLIRYRGQPVSRADLIEHVW